MKIHSALMVVGLAFGFGGCDDGEVGDHTHTKVPAHDHDVTVTNEMLKAATVLGAAETTCVTGAQACDGDNIKTCVDGAWATATACPNAASGDKCWYVFDNNGWRAACTRNCTSAEAAAAKTICHSGQIRTCTEHMHPPYLWNSIHYGAPTACATTGQTCTAADGAEGSCQ